MHYNAFRPSIHDVFRCFQKWTTIHLSDGTTLTAYLVSGDLNYANGYLMHNSYQSLRCRGMKVHPMQQAQSCLNQWVTVTLRNGFSLDFYLTSYDGQMIGGVLPTRQLLPLAHQIMSVDC
ncbi:hypothetical protein [Paenibacillus aestuarii]|uniref:Uncharacterized protein n=1 Tax=Paenibacillus aestuarii TaxID=516965 RepID=A0ABW0K5A5_9BACL|nr:hypothetical protein [Paenibacillus aestuarii]